MDLGLGMLNLTESISSVVMASAPKYELCPGKRSLALSMI